MTARKICLHPSQKGFTLFEVLIAMVVCAVGLLGLAKIAALAVSTTQNAGSRSLIAVQMESLASMMHANSTTDIDKTTNLPRGFWQSGQILKFTASGTTITDSTGLLTNVPASGCVAPATCTPAQIAAVDVNNWDKDMNSQFPTYGATVTCSAPGTVAIAASSTAPTAIDCSINVTWTEKQIAVNATAAAGSATQISTQSYTVYVKP